MPTTQDHTTDPDRPGSLNAFVQVKYQHAGFHRWPEPTPGREYLGERHHHVFTFELTIEVADADREIEFHDLRDWLATVLASHYGGATAILPYELGNHSCEMVAHAIMAQVLIRFNYDYDKRIQVKVSEDEQYTGIVTFTPTN